MAYDVFTRPGSWTRAQATSRWRGATVLVVAVCALAVLGLLFLVVGRGAGAVGSVGIVVVALVARVLERRTELAIDDAANWRKGAASEERIGDELGELVRDGFTVMHDIEQDREGNIDHVVWGPTGVFLVESKHRTYADGAPVKAKRQAAKLHDALGVWVTPVICLDRRDQPPVKRQGVWFMSRTHIRDWIRSQRNATVEFERLARWADSL